MMLAVVEFLDVVEYCVMMVDNVGLEEKVDR